MQTPRAPSLRSEMHTPACIPKFASHSANQAESAAPMRRMLWASHAGTTPHGRYNTPWQWIAILQNGGGSNTQRNHPPMHGWQDGVLTRLLSPAPSRRVSGRCWPRGRAGRICAARSGDIHRFQRPSACALTFISSISGCTVQRRSDAASSCQPPADTLENLCQTEHKVSSLRPQQHHLKALLAPLRNGVSMVRSHYRTLYTAENEQEGGSKHLQLWLSRVDMLPHEGPHTIAQLGNPLGRLESCCWTIFSPCRCNIRHNPQTCRNGHGLSRKAQTEAANIAMRCCLMSLSIGNCLLAQHLRRHPGQLKHIPMSHELRMK